jgi:hypothetical protein
MPGNVIGSIGNNPVELNNAATESTLVQLLNSSKTSTAAIMALAKKANIDTAKLQAELDASTKIVDKFGNEVEQNEKSLKKLDENTSRLKENFNKVSGEIQKLTSGSAQASYVLGILARQSGVVGLVGVGMMELAKIQESYLKTYQDISKSGALFGGSLTDLRLAAANSFLTMDQFTAVIKKNSTVFASMSGNLQEGINQFVKIQNALLRPESAIARNLAHLGYTAAEAADLTASYMATQGTMNKMELQDTKKVSESVQLYAQELTLLSSLTGESREALQQKLQAETQEAQFQAYLASLAPAEADKLRQGLQYAMTQGGQGAVDALKAMALGFPPMTRAGQLYMATQQAGIQALRQYNDVAKNSAITTDEAAKLNRQTLARQIAEGQNDRERLRKVLEADALAGGELAKSFADATKLQTRFIGMTQDQIQAELDKMNAENQRQSSQAQAAKEVTDQLNRLAQSILSALLPVLDLLLPPLNAAVSTVAKFATNMSSLIADFDSLKFIIGAVTAAFILYQTKLMLASVKNLTGSDTFAGKGGKKVSKIGLGAGALTAGILSEMASDKLRETGSERAAAGVDILGSAAGGAAIGAMLGPIGAAIGGLLGAGAGLYQNWGTLAGEQKPVKLAIGGIVTKPTSAIIGEGNESEAVLPLSQLDQMLSNSDNNMTASAIESLRNELRTLNMQNLEMLRYMRDTAEYTRKTNEATRSLNSNMFA